MRRTGRRVDCMFEEVATMVWGNGWMSTEDVVDGCGERVVGVSVLLPCGVRRSMFGVC